MGHTNFVDLFSAHAVERPDQVAYRFLTDGETKEDNLSYAALARHARTIGAHLGSEGVPGERALLLYPPGTEYLTSFFGCLFGGFVAVPAYPPDPSPARLKRTLPRLMKIIEDAGASTILTTKAIRQMAPMLFALAPELERLRWVATDELDDSLESSWQRPDIDASTLAFLQYTSGSTGDPKGVMLTHENLLDNIDTIGVKFEFVPDVHCVTWLPPYHDMGLIGTILTPLVRGGQTTAMSPLSFLRRPFRWVQAISRYGGTVAGAPNFAYDLCVRKSTPEQRAELDLSTWTLAFTGAEPVRHETMSRFTEAYAAAGFKWNHFYPTYGLAEATLLVTGGRRAAEPVMMHVDAAALEKDEIVKLEGEADRDKRRTIVGCGTIDARQDSLAIVDPQTLEKLPEGRVGELWLKIRSAAIGYWERPELSAETFEATTADGDGPFMRTGDLAVVDGGEVYITGRIKDMIILRGANHYPHDIEETVESAHPHVRKGCIAAFGVEIAGQECLALVAECDERSSDFDAEEVIAAIRRAIMQFHNVDAEAVVLIKAKTLPKTSSGKLQRWVTRRDYLAGALDTVAQSVRHPR